MKSSAAGWLCVLCVCVCVGSHIGHSSSSLCEGRRMSTYKLRERNEPIEEGENEERKKIKGRAMRLLVAGVVLGPCPAPTLARRIGTVKAF